MARRRRNRTGSLLLLMMVMLGGGASAYYAGILPWGSDGAAGPEGRLPLTSSRADTADPNGGPYAHLPERGTNPEAPVGDGPRDVKRGRSLVNVGRTALANHELVAARAQLNEALAYDLPLEELVALKADLTRLATETVFSPRITAGDPFVAWHVIAPGETLEKIARKYAVTADLLARINSLADKNRIRGGQRIKVVQGPFRAVVSKAAFTLDIYLGDTFVRQYPVGLGADDGTPTGRWRIRNKLENPQYNPPRGGKIILADDPANPLGERWIGLEGVGGGAVGQLRYGIHGTIDPDSIGQSVSLGCIRMHNADVEEVYEMLVEGKSEVVVK
ncbi:MAG: L,D-transpeptidase family protein [Planctomycetes bacterium]|nr:L,D-transpeptidase family protein [Planctomycetota bacterium]